MDTSKRSPSDGEGDDPMTPRPGVPARPLHRLAAVRRAKRVSHHTLARRMAADTGNVEAQEQETTDLLLSTLWKWADALGVSVTELLLESDSSYFSPLVDPVQAVRLMKTAKMILRRARQVEVQRMAQTLVNQLIELMPELKDFDPEPAAGQGHGIDGVGPLVPRSMPDDVFMDSEDDL